MAKNQTRGVQALRWQTFGLVLFAVVSVAGMTLGYVLQRKAHQRLGEQLGGLERRAQSLSAILDQRRILHTRLSSAGELRLKIQEFHLDLTNINPSQRLFVQAPTVRMPSVAAAATVPNRVSDFRSSSAFQPPLAAASR